MNINAKQKLVKQVIDLYPEAANDDMLPVTLVWEREGVFDKLHISQEDLYMALRKATRSETITRRRRELHNLGLINYSDAVDTIREKAYIKERELHGEAVSWL